MDINLKHPEIAVINAGSSSIKFAAFNLTQGLKKSVSGTIENILTAPSMVIKDEKGTTLIKQSYDSPKTYAYFYDTVFQFFADQEIDIVAVGHRVVHGGKDYHEPVRVTPSVIKDLSAFISYAPLHQPYNLEAISIISQAYPHLPQVACFDTAFHWTHPKVADLFALPMHFYDEGICRYGFHGLSYEYINYQIQQLCPEKAMGRIIVAHLGNGASLCAIKNGISIDSSMGFSALEGLVMGTRPGTLDPGVLLYLMQFKQMGFEALQNLLYRESGLLGLSGISNDMRILIEQASHNPNAKMAIDVFIYRLIREFGALGNVLQGCDLFVFTGGIGENAAPIRQAVMDQLAWCGVKGDPKRNQNRESVISTPDSPIEVRIIPTNEEWIIAKQSASLLGL